MSCLSRPVVLGALLTAIGLWSGASAAMAEDWGTVKGQVAWADGPLPQPRELSIDKDQDHCLAKGKLWSEDWVVNPDNKGVRWVYVWLIPDPESGVQKLAIHPALAKVADRKLVLDQPCCQFVPHALTLRQGEVLVVKNSSPIPHSVAWNGGARNPGNNVSLPAGAAIEVKDLVASPSPVTVSCFVHTWMKAWIRVFDHPYYALTDADGKFEIKQAPAGKCRLVIWHEEGGWGPGGKQGQPVTIPANGAVEVGPIGIKPAQ